MAAHAASGPLALPVCDPVKVWSAGRRSRRHHRLPRRKPRYAPSGLLASTVSRAPRSAVTRACEWWMIGLAG